MVANWKHLGRAISIHCLAWLLWMATAPLSQAQTAADLRLVPFPKDVQLEHGRFSLDRRLLVEISQAQAQVLGQQIRAEFELAGYPAPIVRSLKTASPVLRLSTRPRRAIKKLPLRDKSDPEHYVLQIQPNAVTLTGAGQPGLFYGVQTIRQLIRANRHNDSLPALSISDWPALKWRGFQDDITRGPSSTLQNLRQQAGLGAFFKLNLFTYYMEHQFGFKKHTLIGPKDGSLLPEELRQLVASSQPLHVNILGNQQSFGHFGAILQLPEYAALRETPNLLNPTNEKTYRLLEDFYSEVAPLLPFPYFNVCCDETDGLGEGPSKPTAQKLGKGALYVEHVRRLHALLKKHDKRMLMWGDIILRHPEQLHRIPKDTVMLTWGYDARADFDEQITPFVQAGYTYVVCPGVSGWNRILPYFGVARTNIQNFVRDGHQHGALGMLNTAWDDDAETFNAPNWVGFAWGAECAWNGSSTSFSDFTRRLGAVLFGEPGAVFGRAIDSLSTPGIDGMPNAAFWKFHFRPAHVRSAESAKEHWTTLLEPVRAAIADLELCKKQASSNSELLDYFLFGARRMELCFQRELNRVDAAVLYRNARRLPLPQALPLVAQIEDLLRSDKHAHEALAHRFAELWARENRPYALTWTLQRYQELIERYDAQLERLSRIQTNAKPDRSLPTPREACLELIDDGR